MKKIKSVEEGAALVQRYKQLIYSVEIQMRHLSRGEEPRGKMKLTESSKYAVRAQHRSHFDRKNAMLGGIIDSGTKGLTKSEAKKIYGKHFYAEATAALEELCESGDIVVLRVPFIDAYGRTCHILRYYNSEE